MGYNLTNGGLEMVKADRNSNKKRILIIENGYEMRSLLEKYINEEEFVIDSVSNCLDAIKEISRKPVNLTIIHNKIYGSNDLKILPLLKKYQPDISIVVVSNFERDKSFYKIFGRDANFFIQKPIDLERLKLLIDDLISSR